MPGYDPRNDPEFQAGAAELNQHLKNGNPDWGVYNEETDEPKKPGCGAAAVAGMLFLVGIGAAYVGHRYGGMA